MNRDPEKRADRPKDSEESKPSSTADEIAAAAMDVNPPTEPRHEDDDEDAERSPRGRDEPTA